MIRDDMNWNSLVRPADASAMAFSDCRCALGNPDHLASGKSRPVLVRDTQGFFMPGVLGRRDVQSENDGEVRSERHLPLLAGNAAWHARPARTALRSEGRRLSEGGDLERCSCRRWPSFEPTKEDRRQLYIPEESAHGFQTLAWSQSFATR